MLAVEGASAALEFYRDAFGARLIEKIVDADGRIAHSELAIGAVRFMVNDSYPAEGAVAPPTLAGSPVLLVLLLEDVENALARALQAGAQLDRPLHDGLVRNAKLRDPFGHRWMLAQQQDGPA